MADAETLHFFPVMMPNTRKNLGNNIIIIRKKWLTIYVLII